MTDKVSFSKDVLRIEEVAQKHLDLEKSLYFYYTTPGLAQRDVKFIGYSPNEVRLELEQRLRELNLDSAFGILGALEASFRMDFLERCHKRWKDDLSRDFRRLDSLKGKRVALEEDILAAWKQCVPSKKALISEIIGAFRYRHWLAHGRYWVPKLGKRYDFTSVYLLAQEMDFVFQEQNV